MRILASNPDTIGDMVLRQPMYRALQAAGHELTLIVRPSVAPLVAYVAPGAKALLLPTEVYLDDLDAHWPLFDQLFRAARELNPEALLVAPFRWTRFEERLAEELKGVPGLRRFGLSGRLYEGDPYAGSAPPSRLTFDVTAPVEEDQPEVEKNAALAAAVLGVPVESVRPVEPRIEAGEDALAEARQILGRLGLEPGGYWVACVTGTVHVPIKAWPSENWARVLSQGIERHGRRFLFVGLPVERPAAEEVRRMMGKNAEAAPPDGPDGLDEPAGRTRVWMEEGGTLSQLIGLTALSGGYAGHDTGPMHLAAALGKPVLAVFGGGHKLQFFPRGAAGAPSVSLTVGVPCAGCAWTCAFETSHCVKDVPVEQVLRADEDLATGRVVGPQARVLEPATELRDRMIREAALFARKRLRDAGDLSRQLRETDERTVRPMRAELELRSREAADLVGKLAERQSAAAELRGTVERLAAQVHDLSGRLREREAEAAKTAAELADTTREVAVLRRGMSARDAEAAGLRERVRQLELAPSPGPPPAAPRRWRRPSRPWRQIATDLVTGRREYVPRRARGLPKITLATPIPARLLQTSFDCPDCRLDCCLDYRGERCCSCPSTEQAALRQTVESVLAQDYPRFDLVLAPVSEVSEVSEADDRDSSKSAGSGRYRETSREGATRTIDPAAGPFEAIARAFASSDADVIGWLDPGDLLEPGALRRVGEFFRDHPRVKGAVFEDTAEIDGWRFPLPPPAADVYALLNSLPNSPLSFGSVFLRRAPYAALGPIDSSKGRAADWDLLLRFSRRHGLRRPAGQVTCRRSPRAFPPLPDWETAPPPDPVQRKPPAVVPAGEGRHQDLEAVKSEFESTFGLAGRARCGLVHWGVSLRDRVEAVVRRDRLSFRLDAREIRAGALPPLEPPARPADVPACRLTDRAPQRLLFTLPDGAGRAERVYDDPSAHIAWKVGPDLPKPEESVARDENAEAPPPRPTRPTRPTSLYAGYQGGRPWERNLVDLPVPFTPLDEGGPAASSSDRLPAFVAGLANRFNPRLEFLHVGCGDGGALDELRARVGWRLAGCEADSHSAETARGKGYEVWTATPEDLPLTLPVGRGFDLIFLNVAGPPRMPCLLTTLRRLRQVLNAGGFIVITGPNLNSKLIDLFGPTWSGWHASRARVVFGYRGVARLARLADLRLARFRTHTDPAAAALSVQRNRQGLVPATGVPPTTEDVRRGARLAGWAKLLWDWRGKGDTFYAKLQN